jgi:hypothetical protein
VPASNEDVKALSSLSVRVSNLPAKWHLESDDAHVASAPNDLSGGGVRILQYGHGKSFVEVTLTKNTGLDIPSDAQTYPRSESVTVGEHAGYLYSNQALTIAGWNVDEVTTLRVIGIGLSPGRVLRIAEDVHVS